MWQNVVQRLQNASSVKAVVGFGMVQKMPAPPYDVVKPEKATVGRRFRIIAHRAVGDGFKLEDHIRELIVLLNGYTAETARKTHNVLQLEKDSIRDISAISEDGTISMEVSFLMPTRTF